MSKKILILLLLCVSVLTAVSADFSMKQNKFYASISIGPDAFGQNSTLSQTPGNARLSYEFRLPEKHSKLLLGFDFGLNTLSNTFIKRLTAGYGMDLIDHPFLNTEIIALVGIGREDFVDNSELVKNDKSSTIPGYFSIAPELLWRNSVGVFYLFYLHFDAGIRYRFNFSSTANTFPLEFPISIGVGFKL